MILEEEGFRHEMTNRSLLMESASSKIALTIDFHPAFRPRKGLLLVSAHLLSQNSAERRDLILDCVLMDLESFSAYAVSEVVMNSLRRYEVDMSRISAIVSSDTQLIQEAALYLRTRFVPCVAHSITLSVTDTVCPERSFAVLEKVRRLVAEMQRNSSLRMHMKSRLRELKLPDVWPAVEVPIRWNSTYAMILDVLTTLPVLNEVIGKTGMTGIDAEEAALLETIRVFLEPYHTLTKQVCSKDATCSVYLAVGRILISTTEKFLSQTFGEAQRFGRCLLENTSKYFNAWLGDEFLQTAAFLDPRFAYLETIQPMKSWTNTMERFIAVQSSILAAKSPKDQVPRVEDWSHSSTSSSSVWEILREGREDSDVRATNTWSHSDGLRIELQHYGRLLLTSRPAFATDPLHWWRAYMNEFPQLASAAFEYLSTPATSVDCERLFSLNTTSPTGKHSSGKSRRLECMLLVLKANLNKNVARECKAWSAAELHRYSFDEAAAEELYDSSFDDELQWTSSRSDEERAAPALVENVDSMLPFMEVSHLEDMKNKQQ